MLAGPVSRAVGTCQHCLRPGEPRRDSFQGVLFPYPFIIYLLGHKSVFPCGCKASACKSSVFRKVCSCMLPVLVHSVNSLKKIKNPMILPLKASLLFKSFPDPCLFCGPAGILRFTGTWSHMATQLCRVGSSDALLTSACPWVWSLLSRVV